MSGPTDILPDEGHDALRREAREWVVHMRSGEATADDAESLKLWRDRSPAHSAALSEAIALQRRVRAAGETMWATESIPPQVAARPVSRRRTPWHGIALQAPRTRRNFLSGAVAASAGGLVVMSSPFGLWPSLDEWNADYRTGAGQQRTVRLAKGVELALNTRTSIDVDRGSALAIRLITGEAVLSAAGPAALLARAGSGSVTARNAEFALRLDDGRACVICVAGAVDVTVHGRTLRVAAHQQLRYDAGGMSDVAAVEAAKALAWRRGLLIFNHEPLSAVIAELNRYYPGRIMLSGKALAATPVNAVFRIDRIDRAVTQIQGFTGASATNLPGGIILLS